MRLKQNPRKELLGSDFRLEQEHPHRVMLDSNQGRVCLFDIRELSQDNHRFFNSGAQGQYWTWIEAARIEERGQILADSLVFIGIKRR